MEGGLEHYSLHEHPLIYNDDQQEAWCSSACGLPLLLSPSYRCNNDDCSFFLHNACRRLPQELNCVLKDGVNYSLALVVKPPNEEWECDVCRKFMCKINSIAYCGTSPNPQIRFPSHIMSRIRTTIHVHPLCAPFPLEIKSRHDSHEHELVAMRREAQLLCDACGEEHKGLFFSCKEYSCDFFIHKDCAILPRIIDSVVHDHLLAFSYSAFGTVFDPITSKFLRRCQICRKLFRRTAAYYCQHCSKTIHLNCAISSDKNTVYQPVQLPLEDGAHKSLFIHTMLNKKGIVKNEEDDKLSIEKYHEHPNLIFHDNINIDDDYKDYSSSFCNICIQPLITSHPFYSCQEPGCDFLLHKHSREFSSLFECFFCGQPCNGFGYEFDIKEYEMYFFSSTRQVFTADVECASFPRAIKHRLHHGQHILVFIPGVKLPFACCSNINPNRSRIAYKCISCDFMIHAACALLPAKVNHKFDEHPLQLSKSSTNHVSASKHCFCEICEDDIDTNFWFYHCKMCDQFFHIKCIPSVGSLSKIKFGGTHVIPRHLSDHPVTYTRMLNIGDQRCGECKRLIQGFTDSIALQCSKCCYWVHHPCAFPLGHEI
ncbi:hypothetical protein CDL12_06089 [Handroanthus impetiginosus]|uniref:Zinc finger PHD-type domain-containing protein n=1 Tax=Handroanthus impetiginosus TaxID=429701 RepID=A0A2G9HUK5_9LAMI|nr:hypothetical protein CDL12_06089 [Handroanthus impetiginosus]